MALAAPDIAEITQLYAAYNLAVDDGDGDGFAACFVGDGALVTDGSPIEGTAALADFARSVPVGMPGIRHMATNVRVTGERDAATGRSYLMLLIAGAQPQVLMTGRYSDTLRRDNGAWKFVRRDFTIDR
ncbi:MAG TPA: nuclear transport factor 2 family protein [Acidimicrobiales bacterium]|nr:nuclear transport factor 2 family protein [Acidimicrobiales bacterium]